MGHGCWIAYLGHDLAILGQLEVLGQLLWGREHMSVSRKSRCGPLLIWSRFKGEVFLKLTAGAFEVTAALVACCNEDCQ